MRGREFKINNDNYTLSFGVVNNLNQKTLYLKINAWALPKINESLNYKRIVRKLNKKVKAYIYLHLNKKIFDVTKTMVNLNIKESGIRYGKHSFMNCEITLTQINNLNLKSPQLIKSINILIESILTNVIEKDEYFLFYKKKYHTPQKV